MVINVGGADQCELLGIRDGKNDAAIGVLENVGTLVVKELLDHDMAAFHHADMLSGALVLNGRQHLFHPWPAGVYQRPRLHLLPRAGGLIEQVDLPAAVFAAGTQAFAADTDVGAPIGGVAGIEDHQAAVNDPAVGILKSFGEIYFVFRCFLESAKHY